MPELQLRGGEVDGLRLHYVVEGRGPAVIFVHGLGGFAESWRHNVRPLANRATVYSVDLPGFGESAKPRTHYRLGYFASALRGFMDALGLAQASLVGHSLGGAVSITLALTHPSRVERLALVGAIVPGCSYRPSWIYRLVALRGLGELLSLGGSARLYKAARALLPRARPSRDRLLHRLRLCVPHGRRGARGLSGNLAPRADRRRDPRRGLSARAHHAPAAGAADPRPPGPSGAGRALRGSRGRPPARGGSLGR